MNPGDAFSRDAALERVLARLVCDVDAGDVDAGDVDAGDVDAGDVDDAYFLELLDAEGVAPEDRDALRAQGVAALLLHRRLLVGTLRSAVMSVAPLTCAHLGSRLTRDISAFLAQQAPRSRYLREVVENFVVSSLPVWRTAPDVPKFVPDLAHYETALVAVAAAPNAMPLTEDAAPDLAQGLCFIEACRLGAYGYRVNEVSFSETGGFTSPNGSTPERPVVVPAPEPGETLLLVYRDVENQPRCLSLSPLAFRVVERLMSGVPLGEAVSDACKGLNQPLTPQVIDGTATLLGDLAVRGVVLGPTNLR